MLVERALKPDGGVYLNVPPDAESKVSPDWPPWPKLTVKALVVAPVSFAYVGNHVLPTSQGVVVEYTLEPFLKYSIAPLSKSTANPSTSVDAV